MSKLTLPSTLTTKPTLEWDAAEVLTFLEKNKRQYSLNDETIKMLEGINGHAFVELDTEIIKVLNLGPVQSIYVLVLVKELKSMTSGKCHSFVLTTHIC